MIKLYSTHCPKCKVLEMKFKESGINYEIIANNEDVVNTATILGIGSIPFVIDDNKKWYNFQDALIALSQGFFND